ncbi:hypothetical protein C8Q78DRAFT_350379 [Trametes maxima]|nr:hypothetical protein C8Q78DRAFT_350379 [Trametes maxima]
MSSTAIFGCLDFFERRECPVGQTTIIVLFSRPGKNIPIRKAQTAQVRELAIESWPHLYPDIAPFNTFDATTFLVCTCTRTPPSCVKSPLHTSTLTSLPETHQAPTVEPGQILSTSSTTDSPKHPVIPASARTRVLHTTADRNR